MTQAVVQIQIRSLVGREHRVEPTDHLLSWLPRIQMEQHERAYTAPTEHLAKEHPMATNTLLHQTFSSMGDHYLGKIPLDIVCHDTNKSFLKQNPTKQPQDCSLQEYNESKSVL